MASTQLFSAENKRAEAYDIFDLSLEQLLELEVSTGGLSEVKVKDSSSAVTLIRSEQIKYSSAKNLTALLEQYVTGLNVMAHSEGDKIGLRGLIAAENYKLLLLLNGKNITNMVYEGAILELDQWNLDDIDRIEVIRGPGSVTYGTGAIAGVINIITKKSGTNNTPFEVNVAINETYNSQGVSIQYSDSFDDFSMYSFLSYRDTDGYKKPKYYEMDHSLLTDIRIVGQQPDSLFRGQNYLADTFSQPQIKALLDIDWGDNLNVWARYTQSGQTHHFIPQVNVLVEDERQIENGRQVGLKSFIAATEYNYPFGPNSHLKANLTYDNQEYVRWYVRNLESEWQHPDNIRDYAFSQERISASLLYEYSNHKNVNLITGLELTNLNVGAPWGKSSDHIWIREGQHLISNFDTSVYTQNQSLEGRPRSSNHVEIGSGLRFQTLTHLLEASYQISDQTKLTYSHRLDDSNMSSSMYSPRVSMVRELDSSSTLVITAQRALRMLQLRAQYLYQLNDSDAKSDEHESLDGIEVSYTNQLSGTTLFNIRGYYNDIYAIGYTGNDLQFLGDIELVGVDFEVNYKHEDIELHLNHAFVRPLDVRMNQALKNGNNRNNISFSDYYFESRGDFPLLLEGYGNGLNNIHENITKFVLTAKFLDNQLVGQINSQVYWDFDGSYDEMEMYQKAYDNFDISSLSAIEVEGFNQQQAIFDNERRLLEQEDNFGFEYGVSMSLTYAWRHSDSVKMDLSVHVENLTNSKNIYYVSTGSTSTYPTRLKYLEQPTSIGANFRVSF
ncbi:TonB-dependent receptor plug domain-containing protein [Paraglaciecola sp.]|uniref:TonB-dependent receptor plug domain-containing protein n=1 Tax=Paraglaciecola sp. TaxID=1920173 RepID=UPI003EF53C13